MQDVSISTEVTDEHMVQAVCRIFQISLGRRNPEGVEVPGVTEIFDDTRSGKLDYVIRQHCVNNFMYSLSRQ